MPWSVAQLSMMLFRKLIPLSHSGISGTLCHVLKVSFLRPTAPGGGMGFRLYSLLSSGCFHHYKHMTFSLEFRAGGI